MCIRDRTRCKHERVLVSHTLAVLSSELLAMIFPSKLNKQLDISASWPCSTPIRLSQITKKFVSNEVYWLLYKILLLEIEVVSCIIKKVLHI